MRIGIFDSGVGGLTVLKELLKVHPNHEYVYVGDTLRMPYGNKDKELLKKYTDEIIAFLLSKNVDLIIIACGTLSSLVYNKVVNKYQVPIYDILTPMINYLNKCNYKNIGIMATENTISSHIFKNSIYNKNVIEVACPKLATAIEKALPVELLLDEYLEMLNKADIIVLGCTHYPIVYEKIKEKSNKEILTLGTILVQSLKMEKSIKQKIELYFTRIDDELIENISNLIKEDLRVELIFLQK